MSFLFMISVGGLFHAVFGAYPTCTGPYSQFDGYTYIIDPITRQKLWTHCAFFNPEFDHTLCGRVPRPGHRYFLCDPDNVLQANTTMHTTLDNSLIDIHNKGVTLCYDEAGERVRVIVGVALVDRVRLPDLRNPDICTNDCGQLLPWNTGTAWYPNDAEQYQILKIFADGVRNVWNMGKCGNDVIVVYSKEFNKIHISAGYRAAEYLSDSKIARLQDNFLDYVNDGKHYKGIENGLLYLLASLREDLKSVKVAVILISTVSTIAIGGFVWFLVYAAKYYFDVKFLQHRAYQLPWKLLSWILRFISGLWWVQQSMTFAMMVSQKLGGGLMVMLVLILFSCVLLYFFGPPSLVNPDIQ